MAGREHTARRRELCGCVLGRAFVVVGLDGFPGGITLGNRCGSRLVYVLGLDFDKTNLVHYEHHQHRSSSQAVVKPCSMTNQYFIIHFHPTRPPLSSPSHRRSIHGAFFGPWPTAARALLSWSSSSAISAAAQSAPDHVQYQDKKIIWFNSSQLTLPLPPLLAVFQLRPPQIHELVREHGHEKDLGQGPAEGLVETSLCR